MIDKPTWSEAYQVVFMQKASEALKIDLLDESRTAKRFSEMKHFQELMEKDEQYKEEKNDLLIKYRKEHPEKIDKESKAFQNLKKDISKLDGHENHQILTIVEKDIEEFRNTCKEHGINNKKDLDNNIEPYKKILIGAKDINMKSLINLKNNGTVDMMEENERKNEKLNSQTNIKKEAKSVKSKPIEAKSFEAKPVKDKEKTTGNLFNKFKKKIKEQLVKAGEKIVKITGTVKNKIDTEIDSMPPTNKTEAKSDAQLKKAASVFPFAVNKTVEMVNDLINKKPESKSTTNPPFPSSKEEKSKSNINKEQQNSQSKIETIDKGLQNAINTLGPSQMERDKANVAAEGELAALINSGKVEMKGAKNLFLHRQYQRSYR